MFRLAWLSLALSGSLMASEIEITAIYNPNCGCCHKYFQLLESKGFKVKRKVVSQNQLYEAKNKLGVPVDKRSCHTMVVNGKFVEGHVPTEGIKKLLESKNAKGVFSPHGTLSGWGREESGYELIE